MAKVSTYLKDIDAVCAALGIKLPKQSNRARKLRDPVVDWTRQENLPPGARPFPAKAQYGWERAAVVRWNEERKKIANCQLPIAKSPQDLPPQGNAPEGELFPQPATEADEKIRLGKLFSKWREGKSSIKDERVLFAHGLIRSDQMRIPDDGGEEIYGGVEAVAQAIMKEFPGTVVHAQYVSDWLKGKRYPCTKPGVPPMPAPHQSGRFSRSQIIEWYREYVLPEQAAAPKEFGALGGTMQDARSRKEAADAEMAEMAARQMREADDQNYLRRDVFYDLMAECGVIVFGNCNRFEPALLKKVGEKCNELAVPEPDRVRFMDLLRAVLPAAIDGLRNEIAAGIDGVKTRTKTG